MNLSTRWQRVNLLGIDVFAMRMEEVLDLCQDHIANKTNLLIGVINVAKAVKSRKDTQLKNSLYDADIVLADGFGIVLLSKMIGKALPERIAGIDLMYKLLERSDRKNYRVYFLGATKQVVEKVVENVKENYPGLQIAGYHDGYFNQSQEEIITSDIKESDADILFVAIPSPKKENFLSKWRKEINVPICHGVGGSFDIMAGVTKRSPLWMQNHGLEWLYRVYQEPRKMWKRYLVTNTIFIKLSLETIIQTRFNKMFKAQK